MPTGRSSSSRISCSSRTSGRGSSATASAAHHIWSSKCCRPPRASVASRTGIKWFARYGVDEGWLIRQDERAVGVLNLATHGVTARRLHRRVDPIRCARAAGHELSLGDVIAFD